MFGPQRFSESDSYSGPIGEPLLRPAAAGFCADHSHFSPNQKFAEKTLLQMLQTHAYVRRVTGCHRTQNELIAHLFLILQFVEPIRAAPSFVNDTALIDTFAAPRHKRRGCPSRTLPENTPRAT